ncbi:MAG: spore maturation protein [Clostridia bacterium]|nr:spore maturation protein [Clostridia bacterium]
MRGILPILILFVFGFALIKKRPVFADFCDGVKDGLHVCLNIFPTLLLVLTAVGVFRSSGAMEGLTGALAPLCQVSNFPTEILPLALIRPLSGGGALSVCESMLKTYGANSFVGRMASVLSASTETTFYTLAVYLPKKSMKGTGRFIVCALLCDCFTLFLSVFICRLIL